jgi:hypothetical protein
MTDEVTRIDSIHKMNSPIHKLSVDHNGLPIVGPVKVNHRDTLLVHADHPGLHHLQQNNCDKAKLTDSVSTMTRFHFAFF